MSTRRMIVIGGVAAGMSAASQARRLDPELEISVFERGEWVSYSACGLPYFVGGLVPNTNRLVARDVAGFAKMGIDVRLKHHITAIDAQAKVIHGEHQGQPFSSSYDVLMYATGARPRQLEIPGAESKGIFNLYTMNDALAIKAFIQERSPKRAVVVGGGYIGLEAAENLAQLGIQVSVVQRNAYPFPNLDANIAELVIAELERQHVDLSLSDSVARTCGSKNGYVSCIETRHKTIETDMVLVSIGIQPNSELAAAAGARLGVANAVAVDEGQASSLPDMYAAGDCATHRHRVSGGTAWVPLGTTANKQGRVAGTNAGGGTATFKGIVGTAISRVFEMEVGRSGLSSKEAMAAGLDPVEITVDSTDIAGYYPDAAPLRLKMIAEKGSARLLGVQAAGKGVDKRIDVAATALHAGLSIEELAWIDLGYAPPFNSVWDVLHVAANKLLREC